MATTSNMFMYALTLKPPSAVTQAVVGQFAGTKEQQIVAAAGSRLSMYRLDEESTRLVPVVEHDVFGIVRKIAPFRLAGSPKDYLVISSDSGRLTIVEYIPAKNRWQQVHLETFGKSGVRRVIPGEYLATDPKGRACMIASVEKNKLVYVLNRNPQQKVTISSPLEAHRPSTLVYAVIGLDVGYDNPVFAVLEVNYSECDQDATGIAVENVEKQLVYYELDLGLNHVVRKWEKTVERTSNMLFQVPGGQDGPSGVLVCAEETITYLHNAQEPLRVAIPRRKGKTENPERKRFIVSGVSYKIRNGFFFLLQTEDGDIFKVSFKSNVEAGMIIVEDMVIKYFDTIPVASSFCILRLGYLFIPSETGDHVLYGFDHLAEEDDELEFGSEQFMPIEESYEPVYFSPRPNYNITAVHKVDTLNPIMAAKVANLTDEDAPQIYTICGTGARSSFKTIRHGLEVNEIVDSELPNSPNAVWTVKLQREDEYDSYIVLSFNNDTLVLGIGETVEEVRDTQFVPGVPTLAVQQMGDDLVVQIFPKGIRSITSSKQVKSEWNCPTHRTIVAAATNQQQVAVALSSGEILYFELDEDDILREWEDTVNMTGTVTCLSMGEVPEGRQHSDFLAIGCDDSTVRVLSLKEDNRLSNLSVQALTSSPTALNIIPMADSSSGGTTLYLHIGLYSGVYIRTVLDEVTGNLSDTRTRFLGPRPVKIFRVTVKGRPAALALSSRSWLAYTEEHTDIFHLAPLHHGSVEWAWNFTSEICPEGMVAVQGTHLQIFNIENLSTNLLTETIPLMYTPRQFTRLPDHPIFYVSQSNPNTLSPATRDKLLHEANGVVDGMNGDAEELPFEDFGYPKGTRHWSSCIQVIDPVNDKAVLSTVHLEENETAVSLAVVPFTSQNDQHFLLVGTAQDLILSPREYKTCSIHVYEIQENGRSLKFVHKTKVDHPALSIIPFQGRALVGSGNNLRIYDLGLRQLLRKAQCLDVVPNMVVGLDTQGSRIIVSDVRDSVTYVVYKHQDNMLIPFADDMIARWTTSAAMVDYESVAGGDKFGNLWVVRAPKKASDEADEDNSGAHLMHEKGYLQGTPNRLEAMVHYYTQDIPTSVQKTQLVAGGRDVLFWAGLQGTLGLMVPFVSREDVDFFQQLEVEMRKEDPPLAGRDHLIYRGYYVPVKGAIDGDLCERFVRLDRGKKEMIAGELDRSVREVERKIADMRTRVAF